MSRSRHLIFLTITILPGFAALGGWNILLTAGESEIWLILATAKDPYGFPPKRFCVPNWVASEIL